ncbi:uncharacterized protein PAC_12014 [Phialocephala subalpina]|uniref:Heterokaryon incompatibility domain-containing protein n=1 Tax=Phialocephala subalpina TaxID=576137 RepID=A0A1L7XAW9_9HELO|nr:uncharacterized protein PAC_12014 [Phialocephala subalpina]
MFTRFNYTPLDPSKNEIRFIKILAKNEDDPAPALRGELIHTPLEDDTFIAVSYAWEDFTLSDYPPASQCMINFSSGSQLSIGRNLTALLQAAQTLMLGKLVWIDAICINQEDFAERSREVTRMRDIYTAASDVLVWLGPEENDSGSALSLIGMIANQIQTTNPSFEDFQENPDRDMLQALWFTVDRLATDERDKIYGILGISSDAQQIVPEADYTLTVSDLYRNVAEAMSKSRGDVDFFSLVFNRGNGSIGPPWFQAAGGIRPAVSFDTNKQSFIAEGFMKDIVDGLGPAWFNANTNMIRSQSVLKHYSTDEETFKALWMSLVASLNEVDDGFALALDIFGELLAAQCCNLEAEITHKLEALTLNSEGSEVDICKGFTCWYSRHRNWCFAGKTVHERTQTIHASNPSPILSPLEHESWSDFDRMWK